jgi:hypothetical protein
MLYQKENLNRSTVRTLDPQRGLSAAPLAALSR